MIGATEGPWGNPGKRGLSFLSFGGHMELLGLRGRYCEDSVRFGKNLYGIKGDYFNYRDLLIDIGLMMRGVGMEGEDHQ